MNRKTFSTLIVASAIAASGLNAQTASITGAAKWADSASREIEAASSAGDATRLRNAKTLLDRALTVFPKDALLLHYKGYELFREANLLEGIGKHDETEALLDAAQDALESSIAVKPIAESHALLSSVLGRKIAFHPIKAVMLGPQSGQHMTEAVALGPNNPRVWLLRGQGAMFTPAMFGGGLTNAETYFKKAEQLFANDHVAAPAPSWGKAELYAWLGQLYQKQNKSSDAVVAYNKALEIDPNMQWVKFVLLPSAQGH